MQRLRRRAFVVVCALSAVTFAGSAMARPVHRAATVLPVAFTQDTRSPDAHPYPMDGAQAFADTAARGLSRRTAHAYGGYTSNALVSEARRHLGTNPTGRRRLWCGAFMDMVLKRTGHKGGGNLARSYASYGARIAGPQVGAIAIMRRGGGGGHVGVVSGIDPNGNPIIVSGNYRRTVAEAVYPRRRVTTYVLPGN